MAETAMQALLRRLDAVPRDAGTLLMLLFTVAGFLLPMLWVYPPVAPRPSDFLSETHTKLGDEEEEEKEKGGVGAERGGASSPAESDGPPRIAGLWVYPVKSCRGVRVQRSTVLPTGLAFDRLFAFAQLKSAFPARAGAVVKGGQEVPATRDDGDDDPWDTITQRQFPMLATLQVEVWRPDLAKAKKAQSGMRASDLAGPAGRAASMGETFVVVRYPWVEKGAWAAACAWTAAKLARGWRAVPEEEVVLPVGPDGGEEEKKKKEDNDGKAVYGRLRVGRDVVRARDLSAELPPSLQLYLGVSNKLGVFRVDPSNLRQILRCAPRQDEAGYQPVTSFQDAYPVHLLSRSSVQALGASLPADAALADFDERRFRPNIVVTGLPAYDEDSWKEVAFQPAAKSSSLDVAKFHVSCRTVRCKLPNVDQDTGERHPREPDHTLRTTRDIDAGAPNMGCLGMQLTPLFAQPHRPELMELTVEVGMAISVRERGEHLYIKA